MVATYWSVSVTVLMAQTEITETGMRRDVRITSTHAMVRLVRGARGPFVSWAGDTVTLEAALRVELWSHRTRSHDSPLASSLSRMSMRLPAFCVITPAGVIAPPTGPSEGSEEPSCPAAGHGIGSRRRIQFTIDTLQMGLESVHRNEKLACDLSGGETCLQVAKDALLTSAQFAVSDGGLIPSWATMRSATVTRVSA